MREQKPTRKPRNRRRVVVVSIALSLMVAMALPLTGYLAYEMGLVQIAHAQEGSADDTTNPRAEYWRAVRGGVEGYSAVTGPESGVLIQDAGQSWRATRNDTILLYGGWFLVAIVIAMAAKHAVAGKDKLEERTGRTILRWSAFDRALHWFVGISFVILAITGLSLTFGRIVLIPLMGKEGFAAWAQLAKPIHDYLALPFAVGFILQLLLLLPKNVLRSHDFAWLKSLGGRFGGGHPDADFINGGEKLFFWLLFFGGIALTVSGFYLLFPNLDFSRSTMQLANVVHLIMGVFVIGIALGHIYLGSVGTEGVLDGMVSGEVDEGFAKQHHNLWYEEVKGGTPAASEPAATGEASGAAPT
jgi:formate dehydrogenase subunit gamma